MVKKIFYLVVMNLLIIGMANCKEKNETNYSIKKNELIINGTLNVDLSKSIKEVLDKLGNQYEKESIPGNVGYYLKNYPISFFVNNETNKINEILFEFYNARNNQSINRLITKDFIFKNDTSYNDIINFLDKDNIKYSTKRATVVTYIEPNNYYIAWIIYKNDNFKKLYKVHINVDEMK